MNMEKEVGNIPSNNLKDVKHKIVVISGKGGVGKSTVAASIASLLSREGAKVGLLDVDIHGPNIPKMLGLEGQKLGGTDRRIEPITYSGMKIMSMGFLMEDEDAPVIWRGPMKVGVIRQFLSEVDWGELDYLIIDLPPGTGDEPLSIAQELPDCDGAVIITTPQDVALQDSRKSIHFAERLNMPILGIVENMSGFVCPHCGKRTDVFKYGGGAQTSWDLKIHFLGRIALDPIIMNAADSGKLFSLISETSNASKSLEEVVKQLKFQLTKKPRKKK